MRGNNTLATALVAAALIVILISNLLDLRRAHADLETALENQKSALVANSKAERQLNALASGLNQLALTGNQNASLIVATLKQNGVSIN